jgi:hypothetical protein
MEYVGTLIAAVREDAQVQAVATSDAQIVRWLNFGLERLQSVITKQRPTYFIHSEEIELQANTESYKTTGAVLFGTRIISVEYSHTGQAADYLKLREVPYSHRRNAVDLERFTYSRNGSEISLHPVPDTSTGKLRVRYERRFKKLAERAAKILDSTPDRYDVEPILDEALFNSVEYYNVVGEFGPIVHENFLGSYDPASNRFTISNGTGNEDDYVILGEHTSTHTEVEENCDRFLILYACVRAARKAKRQVEADQFNSELAAIEKEIREAYEVDDGDDGEITIVDPELMLVS